MAEKSIELDSVEIAAAIFGNCDRNIRLLEKEFSVTAVCRGTMLRLSGEEANVAAAVRAGDAAPDRKPHAAGGSDGALLPEPCSRWKGAACPGAD